MGVAEDFPTDPFTPSLRYAATCQIPITVPWAYEPIKLGTSLSVSRSPDIKSEFTKESAFSQYSLQQSKLVFTSASRGNVTEAETARATSSSEHVDLSIAGQIGGSFIGASGQVKYEKHVMNDNSSVQSSFRSTYRSGKVTFLEVPKLSTQAVDLLRSSKDPHESFKNEFGEYYVAAYVFGGSNANMLGGTAARSSFSKDLGGSYTVKVLFVKKTKAIEDHERSSTDIGIASLSAYDTLDKWEMSSAVTDKGSYASIIRAAEENSSKGWSLASRVTAKATEMGLETGTEVPWEKCYSLCRAGLIVELLLLPYAGLREYMEAVLAGPSAR